MRRLPLRGPERTPERPGPGPVPDAVLRSLDLAVMRRIQSIVPGDHITPQVGAGTELAMIRPYQPGDDVRYIDWNVTARMREPHVRVHVGERAMTAWLMLDVSPSMSFGTALRRKADVAEGVSIAVGHVATRRGNRLGVVSFGGPEPRVLRPRQGRLGLLGLLAELRAEPPADGSGATSLGEASRRMAALARARGLVVVVSDFRGPRDWESGLRSLRARHGVLAVEIRDPRELELPAAGDVWMVDPETGRQIVVNTSRRRVRERFKAAAAADREEVAAALRRAGADHLVLSTAGDWLRDLAAHLRRADQMRRSAMAAGGPGRAAVAAHKVPGGESASAGPEVTRRRVRRDDDSGGAEPAVTRRHRRRAARAASKGEAGS
ncbi:MAG TPA: DUF58 domain-containing protein [Solirubrobacteraceae bacterium]|nr:DUF58 domain-containing protein [Solirubrobacteraceae bacterium]